MKKENSVDDRQDAEQKKRGEHFLSKRHKWNLWNARSDLPNELNKSKHNYT